LIRRTEVIKTSFSGKGSIKPSPTTVDEEPIYMLIGNLCK